ncbi:hypothetical protein A5747_13295 [Mycobacterium sp. IS-836]|uniref:hypothetical protein n=1 Tax=Mycobacterium sp. IS-836 TaxID=1834160 RepID=UPI00096E6853|nr:hypothetical protein [Mycobacterium sp. IS-836]OMC55363.1 hypothetical protein A5747_13295 [Mycobacterium sp. IS-836]
MAVTAKFYSSFFLSVLNKEVDLDADTIKVMLCTSAYSPNQDTHRYKSDVTNEITGTGYTAGGVSMTSIQITYNATTNTITIDGDDAQWTSATFTARYAVIYDTTPSGDSARPLIGYVDFGADIAVSAGTFTVSWDAAGFGTVVVA